MYTVHADNTLIHDSSSPIRELHLIDPNLKEIDSAAGTFEFTVPSSNPGYDVINRFTTTIIVRKEGTTIWTGRVITESEDFWKRRKFSCEGALAYLNDSMQPQEYYDNMNLNTFFRRLITNHNNRVNSSRQMTVGAITMINPAEPFNYKTEYKSTWDTIKDNFIDKLGGHIRVRYNGSSINPIIDYYGDYPNTATQEINFGENLLDFTRNWNMTNLCTIIIPRGKQLEDENSHGDKEYTTIKSVNNGSIYLQNSTAVARYGKVERVVDFSDCDNPSTLKDLGTEYLNSTQFDEMVLEVSAVDLHMIDSTIRGFELLDEVVCISYPHGLNKKFPITEIDTPLDKPEGVKYKMGSNVVPTMSSGVASSGKAFENKINTGLANTLAEAKKNASNILNAATTGYVNIITENDISQALVITDVPEYTNASKYWKFNMNGLGYTNDGGQTYEMALTFDGTVTANYMHVGLIDDGHGYNRWNLTTGEFQMAYNSEVANSLGNTIQVLDIVTLAQQGVDDAEEAQETADTAIHKQSGGTNILNGTNKNLKVLTTENSNWEDGTWDGRVGASANKSVVDVSGVPNSAIVKAFKLQLSANNSETFITQRNVKVTAGQVYVLSCYAKGAGKVSLGYFYGNEAISKTQSAVTDEWKRYSLAIKIASGRTSVNVVFGSTGFDRNIVYICGMQLERGNTPSDWGESEKDTYDISTTSSAAYTDSSADAVKTYSAKYTDTISKNDREFTKAQRQALDESFTQQKVLQRLTKNYTNKGIYLKDNQLYMNATYIRSGTLDAGIIKAGVIMDARVFGNTYNGERFSSESQRSKWNLATGHLYTDKMEARRMRASGRFECGDYYKIVNDGGEIRGYRGTSCVGSISPNAEIKNLDNGRMMYGLMIRASGHIDVRTPSLGIRTSNDDGTSTRCYTGNFRFSCVRGLNGDGGGGFSWWEDTHNIRIINGLIVAIA